MVMCSPGSVTVAIPNFGPRGKGFKQFNGAKNRGGQIIIIIPGKKITAVPGQKVRE